jgi:hypothetical protein
MSSTTEYPLSVRYALDDEWMDCLIEMAGYGMTYWAHEAWEDEDGASYTVVWYDEGTTVKNTKTVSRGALARAVQKILSRQTNLGSHACDAVMNAVLDAGDIDADVADSVVQVALFGTAVYG